MDADPEILTDVFPEANISCEVLRGVRGVGTVGGVRLELEAVLALPVPDEHRFGAVLLPEFQPDVAAAVAGHIVKGDAPVIGRGVRDFNGIGDAVKADLFRLVVIKCRPFAADADADRRFHAVLHDRAPVVYHARGAPVLARQLLRRGLLSAAGGEGQEECKGQKQGKCSFHDSIYPFRFLPGKKFHRTETLYGGMFRKSINQRLTRLL